jgi:arylsulfate sulfotransferase
LASAPYKLGALMCSQVFRLLNPIRFNWPFAVKMLPMSRVIGLIPRLAFGFLAVVLVSASTPASAQTEGVTPFQIEPPFLSAPSLTLQIESQSSSEQTSTRSRQAPSSFPSPIVPVRNPVPVRGTGSGTNPGAAASYTFPPTAILTTALGTVTTVFDNSNSPLTVAPALTGDSSFSISSGVSCSTVDANSPCSITVKFAPRAIGDFSTTLTYTNSSGTQSMNITGSGQALALGESIVSGTDSPQVALYTIRPSTAGSVYIEFGTTTSYGTQTSATSVNSFLAPPIPIYVAGMLANTTYHMRAVMTSAAGVVTYDSDHTFTTTSVDSSILPGINSGPYSGETPQPGIELMDASIGPEGYLQAYAINLSGKIIWTYDYADRSTSSIIQPISPLPNGHFLVEISYPSQDGLGGETGGPNVLREIDLAGEAIRQISIDQLNQRLAAASFTLTALDFSHEAIQLPNGHWLTLVTNTKNFTNLQGFPGTTTVLGDAIVDLDTNLNPVWIWNAFDYLDINRHPLSFPDWTHANAIVYSPDDGNLLLSLRDQNWILKLNYLNGAGDGNVLWHLGYQGDFTLVNGTSPQDWQYAQHDPHFTTKNTTGTFGIAIMDNGNDRMYSNGSPCATNGSPACYTTAPVFTVDESAMTATLDYHGGTNQYPYSYFGGNAEVLGNGDLEFDLTIQSASSNPYVSEVWEFTPVANGAPVWGAYVENGNLYRAYRIPSLYPGVTW